MNLENPKDVTELTKVVYEKRISLSKYDLLYLATEALKLAEDAIYATEEYMDKNQLKMIDLFKDLSKELEKVGV